MNFEVLYLIQFSIFKKKIVECILSRDTKETKKLKGLILENCRCLKHDVQLLNTSITIDFALCCCHNLWDVKSDGCALLNLLKYN